ncbi:YciI family protein [uncultured Roseibium sp.]|uniref:YciI family protein n=1 Tax=uncultured Roseibium sp. TaxID=1936171 RepID=UPI002611B135|nr:YciI family protein [uncultured Roseibium sp.]
MFVVTLTFADNKARAGELMEGHKDWIKKGFDQGLFLMVGSLQPNAGGGIIAHNTTREDLEAFVAEDPFVAEQVVKAEILEITPARLDERLQFLAA